MVTDKLDHMFSFLIMEIVVCTCYITSVLSGSLDKMPNPGLYYFGFAFLMGFIPIVYFQIKDQYEPKEKK